jgi:putative alpha-1,2-mannosidase
VTLNGQPLARAFLGHEEITAGGELVFTMQAQPNRAWPGAQAVQPYSMSQPR